MSSSLTNYQKARRAEDAASQVRGRHYVDWVPILDQWRKERRDDESLALLVEIIDAAERAARVAGREPAPGYTKRAATIYRRRKDYAAEVAVLRRWLAACPPGRGSAAIEERLRTAEQLPAAQ
ncbi:hypothetical protein [Micromonospora sp. CPCC 205739]|uniref:hypothetical protein n=1 Tax=Micromonospora sp. CPCC 205739 TaxID=3122404 RepID=UPI002FEF43FF